MISHAPSGVHNDGADDASGRRIRYLSRPSLPVAKVPKGGAGAKLCRQRSRILRLLQRLPRV
ncbi:hypothetical protein BC826DRAFT_1074792 [Russula brevipes]|nr:hypothetical protein BC826DRAFT_1074792 [Russula brevipes]